MPIVTANQLAKHLNITTPTSDQSAKLEEHLAAAIEHVQSRCGPLDVTEQTMKVRTAGTFLVLPATRLGTVTEVRDPSGDVVDVDADAIDLEAGIVEVPHPMPGTWQVKVTPVEPPKSLKLAVMIIAGHLWETQRGRGDQQRAAMLAAGGDAPRPAGSGFAIPSRASDLMAPYLLPGIG